jgi:5-(hydroxymethyl)furfural/furfural oxidase
VLSDHLHPETVSDVFPARLSQRIERLSRPTMRNEILSRIGALAMDSSKPLRRFLIRRVITNGESLTDILQNDRTIEDYVRSTLGTSWHASGTCRMGARNDDASVVDSSGAVIGARNLFVADASIMPRITRTNTNLPTLMLAERLADLIPKAAA